jgi:sigma-B regulation protein RsbU (phosphoserine phosphatase)
VALERARLYDLSRAYQTRLSQELEMAREVQDSLLPRVLPEIPGATLAAHWQSAREVAGDFYDAFKLPGGRTALLVADVSDKGVHAALYMAMVSSLIRSYARLVESPAALLTSINRQLLKHETAAMFVTLFYGVLDVETGQLTYASAGHDPPLLRRNRGEIEQLMPTGPLLGILDPAQFKEEVVALDPENVLLLYTDGVTDILNETGEAYGRQRLAAKLKLAPLSASTCLQHLCEDLEQFRGSVIPPDDITFLVLSISAPHA